MKKTYPNVKQVYETLNKSTRILIKKEFCAEFNVSRTSFDNRMSDDSFDFVEKNWMRNWFITRGFDGINEPEQATKIA